MLVPKKQKNIDNANNKVSLITGEST
jgi:hypothetical protein